MTDVPNEKNGNGKLPNIKENPIISFMSSKFLPFVQRLANISFIQANYCSEFKVIKM